MAKVLPLIPPDLREKWADLSVSDIEAVLAEKGLTFRLANYDNKHFIVTGKVRTVSLYATTGTVNATRHDQMKPFTCKKMAPKRAFERLASIANIGY